MPTVPEELDVFHVPHDHMKQVVHDIEDQLSRTNFHNAEDYMYLLHMLARSFKDLQSHEDIENNYILSPLLPRLNESRKATLEHDIHSGNRLHGLMCLVDSAPHFVNEFDRIQYGEDLKSSIISFTSEVIPHMKEEEEVFLPLLIEYYTESELRELRNTVLQLHRQRLNKEIQPENEATPPPSRPASLVTLPQEILLKIFSYLNPRDLSALSLTHPSLTGLAFDGSLWRSLHPVRWAEGHWQFHSSLLYDRKELSQDIISTNDATKFLLSCGDSVNALLCQSYEGGDCHYGNDYQSDSQDDEENPRLLRERDIMRGLIDYLLPKVGPHVEVLDLAHGKSLTGEMVYKMLSYCPNIRYLDLSHTQTTDYSFRGLVDSGGSRHLLRYINLSGCTQITDTSLLRIAWSSTPPQAPPTSKSACYNCSCGNSNIYDTAGGVAVGGANEAECELKCLILSGCHQITDVGLSSLAIGRGLPNLQYLDLSSDPRISAVGLNKLVAASPCLKPHLLFYCDNIVNGPHTLDSNGCCNVQRSCCQNLYKS